LDRNRTRAKPPADNIQYANERKCYQFTEEIEMRRPYRDAMSVASNRSGIPAGSLAIGFLALMCGTVVGFELTFNAEARNDANFGYLEALSGPISSSSAGPSAYPSCYGVSAVGVEKYTDDSGEAMREANITRSPSMCRPL
jgi:hypothetical protein